MPDRLPQVEYDPHDIVRSVSSTMSASRVGFGKRVKPAGDDQTTLGVR